MTRVMVVDDADSDLRLMDAILRGAGRRVLALSDGEDLEDTVATDRPDMLLLATVGRLVH